jgi:hypothetical protein
MNRRAITTFVSLVWLAGAGCGEAPGFEVGQEESIGASADEPVTATTSALTTSGCASVYVSRESHTGIFFRSSNPQQTYVQQLAYRISNPSDVDCATMEIDFQLENDLHGTLLEQAFLTTSLSAHKGRNVYWNVNFDTRTFRPATTWDVDAFLYRNGSFLEATYMPGYFLSTGQY